MNEISPINSEMTALQRRDNSHYLHPFTDYSELHAEGATIQDRAEGIYIWDADGRRIIDGLAGLGCVNLGYGRQELADIAARQMKRLSYSQSFFKTSNEPAIALAAKLVQLAPRGLNYVFFANSGSEAVETALKLVHRYWKLAGKPEKNVVIAREQAYHGSTIATTSLSGNPVFYESGGGMPIAGIERIKAPYWYLNGADQSPEAFGLTAAGWLEEKILHVGPERVAAFFAEPFQGAGGAIVPPATYWPEIQNICRKYDVLLVVDEVVSGFGRTGKWFGCETFGIESPDLVTIAKGITSSYFPMSATMVSDRIASMLIEKGGEFYHGFTNSGHPVGAAVALENIRIMELESVVENAADVGHYFGELIASLADHPIVGNVRSCGLFAGIQLVADKETRRLFDESLRVGDRCSAEALQRGLALRAIGDTMALMPPLIITRPQVDEVFEITLEALDATARAFTAQEVG